MVRQALDVRGILPYATPRALAQGHQARKQELRLGAKPRLCRNGSGLVRRQDSRGHARSVFRPPSEREKTVRLAKVPLLPLLRVPRSSQRTPPLRRSYRQAQAHLFLQLGRMGDVRPRKRSQRIKERLRTTQIRRPYQGTQNGTESPSRTLQGTRGHPPDR